MTELESEVDHADLRSASTSSCSRRFLLGKGAAGLFSLLLIGAVLAPIMQNWRTKRGRDTEGGARGDSFPFSPYTETVTVEVVTGGYEFVKYFVGDKTPASEFVRASCPVSDRAAPQQAAGGEP
jgi:hypothetical protein